ncbi:MAG TPA: EAL domain-containing protein, partial [Burkholderiaceae bacterium]|nr:EAL domain-containing protein [Burkholderiaceae bacterium]
LPPIRIAVNLSARQFQDGDIQAMVRRALKDSRLDPKWLELELTEGIVLLNADAVIRTMQSLNGDGVSHALDDFGTGYSSLSYLQRLPVERIKIDRSFVSNITSSPGDAAIARAVVGMAHSLDMTVIAEGVETEGQLGFLRGLGCEEIQGYYFSRPLPEQEFVDLLRTGRGIMPAPKALAPERIVLLVDDDPDVLERFSLTLERDNYQILSTTSANAAFELLATCAVGVVVCDQRMPEMAGAEFLNRVRHLYPDTIRVIMSDHAELSAMLDAINSGAIYKFLGKPWDDEHVLTCLRDAFRLYEITRTNRELLLRLEAIEKKAD